MGISPDRPILYVDGVQRQWKVGSLTVNQSINQRSGCDFTLVEDPGEDITIERGTPVQVVDINGAFEDEVIFNGMVERVSRKAVVAPDDRGIYIECRCVDVHYFADKRTLSGSFAGQSAGQTVRDLVRTTLHEENLYDHPYPGAMIAWSRNDLLGYWRLANNADDDSWWAYSPAATHGTDKGSPTYTVENSALPGADFVEADASPVNDVNMGGHVDLDGSSDYIETGRGGDAIATHSSDGGFTVSVWVRETGVSSGQQTAMSCGNSDSFADGNDFIFSLRRETDANGSRMQGFALDHSGNLVTVTDPDALPQDVWVNYILVADDDGEEVRLFRDGVIVARTAAPGGVHLSTNGNPPVNIGASPSGTADFWGGHLSEAVLIGRALSTYAAGVVYRAASRSVLALVALNDPYFLLPLNDAADDNFARDISVANKVSPYTNDPTRDYVPALVDGGTAVDFDGVDQGVVVEGTGSLFNQGVSITISCWIRPDDVASTQRIICEDDSTAKDGMWGLSLGDPGSGEVRFFIRGASTVNLDTTGSPISADTIHHVVGIYDVDDGTREIWVDGTKVASDTVEAGGTFGDTGITTTVAFDHDHANAFDGTLQHAAVMPSRLPTGEVDEIEDIWLKGSDYYNPNHPGVPASRAEPGTAIEQVVFNYVDGGDALAKLAEVSEFEYFVDPMRTIHFHSRGGNCCRASFTVSGADTLVGNLDLLIETPKYRNRQYVKGGRGQTAELTEHVEITSVDQTSFLTGYPIATEPEVYEDVNGDGSFTQRTVGIRGISESDDYYWSKGEVGVTKDRDRADFAQAGGQIRIVYTGLYPLVAIAEDTDEVENLRRIERAGTGRVDSVVEESSIDTREQGFDLASFQLARYAQRAETVKLTTRAAGLRPGQVVTIDIPRLDISAFDALIEQVDFDEFGGMEFRYSIKAVSGATLRTWHKFFSEPAKKLIVPQDRVNINEDEIASTLTTYSESVSVTEDDTMTEHTCVVLSDPGPSLPFTLC